MPDDFSLGDVEVSLSPQERYAEFLHSRGKKLTRQKQSVTEHIFAKHEHFDADDLVSELSDRSRGQRVSRPTVYRLLGELVEAGLLRKMVLRGRTVYEHDYGYPQHDHLYCTECESLIEFQSDDLARLRQAVAADHQFLVKGHRFIISGICRDCRDAKRRNRSPLDRI